MNYATIKNCDIANGKGIRVSLFVSGCNHHCPGCFNKEAWDFEYGKPFTKNTIDYIVELLKHDYINGLSVLGGEPLDPMNIIRVCEFLFHIKNIFGDSKNIWLYTGYTWEELMERAHIDLMTRATLEKIDVLVDGRFVEAEKDISLLFRGSRNQRIINCKESLKNDGKIILANEWDIK